MADLSSGFCLKTVNQEKILSQFLFCKVQNSLNILDNQCSQAGLGG